MYSMYIGIQLRLSSVCFLFTIFELLSSIGKERRTFYSRVEELPPTVPAIQEENSIDLDFVAFVSLFLSLHEREREREHLQITVARKIIGFFRYKITHIFLRKIPIYLLLPSVLSFVRSNARLSSLSKLKRLSKRRKKERLENFFLKHISDLLRAT